jgi:hypothetical protein
MTVSSLRKTPRASGMNELTENLSWKPTGQTQAISVVTRESEGISKLNQSRTSRFSGNTNLVLHNISHILYKTNSDFSNISHIFCNTNSLSHNIRNFFCNTNFMPGIIQLSKGIIEIEKTISRITKIVIQLKIYASRDGKIVNEKIQSDNQNRATLNDMFLIDYEEQKC